MGIKTELSTLINRGLPLYERTNTQTLFQLIVCVLLNYKLRKFLYLFCYPSLPLQVVQLIPTVYWLVRISITTNGSCGVALGFKVVSDSVAMLEQSIKSFVQLSIAVCLILSSGLQSISLWMVSRYVGQGSSVRQAGTPTSTSGKQQEEERGMGLVYIRQKMIAIILFSFSSSRLAFAIYLLTILTFLWNIRYGIHLTMLLGIIMIMACGAYGLVIHNKPHIRLPWNRANCHPNPSTGEWCATAMVPHFGWSWGLVLATGILVFIMGVVLFFVDFFVPRWTAPLFHHNIIEADEEFLTVS